MSNKNLEEDWQYWFPRVYGYFYKRVNSEYQVEELTSQTMATAFTANNVRNFKAYIWKVAHNYLVRYIQSKNTEPIIVGWDESLDLKNSTEINFSIEEEAEKQVSANYISKLDHLRLCISSQIKDETEKQLIQL